MHRSVLTALQRSHSIFNSFLLYFDWLDLFRLLLPHPSSLCDVIYECSQTGQYLDAIKLRWQGILSLPQIRVQSEWSILKSIFSRSLLRQIKFDSFPAPSHPATSLPATSLPIPVDSASTEKYNSMWRVPTKQNEQNKTGQDGSNENESLRNYICLLYMGLGPRTKSKLPI